MSRSRISTLLLLGAVGSLAACGAGSSPACVTGSCAVIQGAYQTSTPFTTVDCVGGTTLQWPGNMEMATMTQQPAPSPTPATATSSVSMNINQMGIFQGTLHKDGSLTFDPRMVLVQTPSADSYPATLTITATMTKATPPTFAATYTWTRNLDGCQLIVNGTWTPQSM